MIPVSCLTDTQTDKLSRITMLIKGIKNGMNFGEQKTAVIVLTFFTPQKYIHYLNLFDAYSFVDESSNTNHTQEAGRGLNFDSRSTD